MKYPALLCADLHLTANPDHEYRWGLFPWLHEQIAEWKAQTVVVMGDLTDAKDYHPAELANRLVREFVSLVERVEVVLMMGNHDLLKSGHMYFEFLSAIGVKVVTRPQDFGSDCLFLPHSRNPAKDWADLDVSHYSLVLMHQTIKGARASNGQEMDGERLPDLTKWPRILSGDIHVPQKIGPIEYVGSPYHVTHGDTFTPRCLLIDRARRDHDLHFVTPARHSFTVSNLDNLMDRLCAANPGDSVAVTFNLHESEAHKWREMRAAAAAALAEAGVRVKSIEMRAERTAGRARFSRSDVTLQPGDALYRYCEEAGIPAELMDVGMECIE